MRNQSNGFGLVELMVIFAFAAIVMAIGISTFMRHQMENRIEFELSEITTELNAFYAADESSGERSWPCDGHRVNESGEVFECQITDVPDPELTDNQYLPCDYEIRLLYHGEFEGYPESIDFTALTPKARLLQEVDGTTEIQRPPFTEDRWDF